MATGWAKIWLDPHLINGRLEIWDQSYDRDLYIGKMLNPGWDGSEDPTDPYFMSGGPFPAANTYRIKFPEQEINGVLYKATQLPYQFSFTTHLEAIIPITGTVLVAKASITKVSLPDKLEAGDPITGYVDITNIGSSTGRIRCLFITEWNGIPYATGGDLKVGETLRVTPPSLLVMPEVDAVIIMKGQHLEDGVWITDDVKTH